MDRTERAVEIKHSGSNCCQAVLIAFAEELGQDENTLRAMGAAFGCGMGAFDATCGALCASEMILGLKKTAAYLCLRKQRHSTPDSAVCAEVPTAASLRA